MTDQFAFTDLIEERKRPNTRKSMRTARKCTHGLTRYRRAKSRRSARYSHPRSGSPARRSARRLVALAAPYVWPRAWRRHLGRLGQKFDGELMEYIDAGATFAGFFFGPRDGPTTRTAHELNQ